MAIIHAKDQIHIKYLHVPCCSQIYSPFAERVFIKGTPFLMQCYTDSNYSGIKIDVDKHLRQFLCVGSFTSLGSPFLLVFLELTCPLCADSVSLGPCWAKLGTSFDLGEQIATIWFSPLAIVHEEVPLPPAEPFLPQLQELSEANAEQRAHRAWKRPVWLHELKVPLPTRRERAYAFKTF